MISFDIAQCVNVCGVEQKFFASVVFPRLEEAVIDVIKLQSKYGKQIMDNNIILENRNQHLNPQINTFLTDCSNTLQRQLTDKEKKFIKRAYHINVLSGLPFSYFDFPNLSKTDNQTYFRQLILKLKPIIEIVQGGKPKYYKLKRLYLDKELTDRYTSISINDRIFSNLNILFGMTSHEIPQLHKIAFSFNTHGLYERLLQLSYKTTKNKIILLPDIRIHNKIKVNAEVYPTESVILHLACTYTPIDYTFTGFIQLIALLGQVYHSLKRDIAHIDFEIEPVEKWKFIHFDLNRDSISYDFPTKDYTVSMVFRHVQVYSKTFPDGKQKIRYEEQIEPNHVISDELSTPRFQKASELFDN